MLKLYFLLGYEFFKIGLLAIGGGYAAIPFLFYIGQKYGWYTSEQLTNMIAVSNITPGAIGINTATYTGYTVIGVSGAIIGTCAILSAPFFITLYIIKLFGKFQTRSMAQSVFKGLRPASCALLASIGIKLLYQSISVTDFRLAIPEYIDFKSLILFIILLLPFSVIKKNPFLTIAAGALGGIIINL